MGTTRSFIFMLLLFFCGTVFRSHAITLGGTVVPKDHFIVYLGIGHCNFAGRNATSADGVTNPHAWNYAWDSQGSNDTQWVLAQEQNGGSVSGSTAIGYSGLTQRGTGGPSMPFLKGMVQQYPGYYFGMVTNAASGATVRIITGNVITGFSSSDIDNYWKAGGGNRYKEIIGLAQKVENDVTFGGILCMLGLDEVCDGTQAGSSTVKNDFIQMVTNIRTDLGLPNLPFLVNHYEMGATDCFLPTSSLGVMVVKAIDSLPTALTYCDTVSNVGCTYRDDHHFTTQGENLWASNAVACIGKHGWFPTASAVNSPGHDAGIEMSADVSVLHRNASNFVILVSFLKPVRDPALTLFTGKGEVVKGQEYRSANQIRYDVKGYGSGLYVARISSYKMIALNHVIFVP
ncbi:MAG: sialate O-acetylesterase [Chitinivibrionales bacterium]